MVKKVLSLILALALLTGLCTSALAAEGEIDYNISKEVRVLGHLADDARREIFANVAEKLSEKWPNTGLNYRNGENTVTFFGMILWGA